MDAQNRLGAIIERTAALDPFDARLDALSEARYQETPDDRETEAMKAW